MLGAAVDLEDLAGDPRARGRREVERARGDVLDGAGATHRRVAVELVAQLLLRVGAGLPERYGLPRPERGLFQDHPTISDTILSRISHGKIEPRPGIAELTSSGARFRDGHDDELDAKFRELVGPVLGTERTERLLATCWQFDDLDDVSELLVQTVPSDA